jgi:hypothetical protein
VRPVQNVFQKLSCTEQRREGVAAYLCSRLFIRVNEEPGLPRIGSRDPGAHGGAVPGEQGAHKAQPQEALPVRRLCRKGAYQGL